MIFLFVNMIDYIDEFSYGELSLHPWDEAYLIMMDDVFDVFLYLVCGYFIEYFCINVYKGNWSEILLFDSLCVVMWPHRMSLALFLLFVFCEIV